MIALRWAAAAMALVALFDPSVPVPGRARPSIRVIGADTTSLEARLRAAGYPPGAVGAAATVVTSGATDVPRHTGGPIFLLSRDPAISIVRVSVPPTRVGGQAVVVSAALHAAGARGRTTSVRLEDGGVPVATAAHRWTADDDSWDATFSYVPVRAGAAALRLRADTEALTPAVADVLAPPLRGPIRTLVFDPAVGWASVFVRRALEDQPGFSVASVQRATSTAATRAGNPPVSLTRGALAPYEVLVCGRLDRADAAAVDAIRWFVEQRGGVLVLVPDRVPDARTAALLPGVSFESKLIDAPVALRGTADGIAAAELAIPRGLGPLTSPLARDDAGVPVVVSIRRGMGAVVFSGALDAWRYRDRDSAAFSRFWPAVILAEAATVPPRLEVRADPGVVRPGVVVRVRARLRSTELPDGNRLEVPDASALVVDPAARREQRLRLWPAAAPGSYEGEWRPAGVGRHAIEVTIGDARGAAIVDVGNTAAPDAAEEAAIRAAARASGGVFSSEPDLVAALAARFPPAPASRWVRPARSLWWVVAFAACLCAEWTTRRRRGLA